MSTKIRDRLFLVNPKYDELFGKKCYASILDIEDEVDYAAIGVTAMLVPKVLSECIEKGVKAAQIYSAGFGETGIEERIRLENEVKDMAKGRIRLIGPNCFGVYCPKSGLSIIPEASTEEGSVGVISQSGSVAESFSYFGGIRNIKFSKVISYGNAVDLDCSDFLEYLADDPETKVIAIYVEGTRDGKRLKAALSEAASKKPVVGIKGGMTKHGSRAASSHTGSLVGSPETWSSLFKQTGVIQVKDFDELVNAILAFTCSPLPSGKGVSIITNSGGFSVIQADLCVEAGLEVAQFGEETMRELRKMVPTAGTSIGNPLDAWPIYYNIAGDPGNLADIIKIVALDKNIHSLVFQFDQLRYLRRMLGERLGGYMEELVDVMVNGCEYARDAIGKPVFICVSLDPYSEDEEDRRYNLKVKKAFESKRFPVYPSLDASIKALSNIYKYGTRFRLG